MAISDLTHNPADAAQHIRRIALTVCRTLAVLRLVRPPKRISPIYGNRRRAGAAGSLQSIIRRSACDISSRHLFSLLIGGIEALIMRVQLARPDQTLLTPEQYNQLFTMHGVTMIFLYALPILSGFSNYLWPLLLGSRDMAFPAP